MTDGRAGFESNWLPGLEFRKCLLGWLLSVLEAVLDMPERLSICFALSFLVY